MSEAKPTPDRIVQLASGFMAAKYVFAGSELGVFAGLAAGPLALAEIAQRLGVPARPLRIILDALVVLGFLSKAGASYQNAADTQAFLSGQGPADMRPVIRFWNRISYPLWCGLEASIRNDKAAELGKTPSDADNLVFSEAVEALTAGDAASLADVYDFSRHRKLMNVGGWYVSFLLPVLRRFPELEATLLMFPQWRARAEQLLERAPEAMGRVHLTEGDYLFDDLPTGHDAVLISHLVHHMSPAHATAFLRHIRKYVEPGTRLLIIDYFTNQERTQPALGLLLAGQFQITSGEGDVYEAEEAKSWCADAGFRFVEHVQLRGPSSMVVAEAV